MNSGKKPVVAATVLGRFLRMAYFFIPATMLSSCSIDVEKVTLSSSLRNLIGAADGVQFVSGVPSQPSNASSMVIGMSSSTMTQARWIALSGSTCPATLASYGSASALPLPANVDVSSLPDGPVSLCAIGLNQAGQWQTAAQATQVTWIKDTTAPGVISVFSLDLPSSSPSNNTTPRFLLGTLETGETAYVTTDSSCLNTPIATSAQASANGNLTATTANALTEGAYTFYSYRTDQAGNKSACSALTVNYQLDLTAPVFSSSLITNAGASISTAHTPLFEVSDYIENGSGLNRFELALGSSATGTDLLDWSSVGSSRLLAASGLSIPNGTNVHVSIRAVDNAGNISPIITSQYSVKLPIPAPNGIVYDLNLDSANSKLYVGGSFTYVGIPTGSFIDANIDQGGVLSQKTTQNPNAAVNGSISAIVPGGAMGGYFIAGQFTAIGGITGFSNLAHIQANGVPSLWKPQVDGKINSIILEALSTPSKLYLGIAGSFTSVMSQSRTNVALFDVDGLTSASQITSSKVSSWNPAPNGEVLMLKKISNQLAMGGQFTNVSATARSYLAFWPSSNLSTLANQNISPNGAVRAIEAAGVYFLIGGDFTSISGSARNYIARVNDSPPYNLQAAWVNQPDNIVRKIYCWSGDCLVAGDFSTIGPLLSPGIAYVSESTGSQSGSFASSLTAGSKIYTFDFGPNSTVLIGGDFTSVPDHLTNAAIIDLSTGAVQNSFQPAASGPVYVILDINQLGQEYVIGGDFISYGGVGMSNLAAIDLDNRSVDAFYPQIGTGPSTGTVKSIARTGNRLFISGSTFSNINGGARTNNSLAEFEINTGAVLLWEPRSTSGTVTNIYLSGNSLYAMGAFSNMDGDSNQVGISRFDISQAGDPVLVNSFTSGLTAAGDTVLAALDDGANGLFIGGWFSTVHGTSRNSLAKVNATTGALDASFNSNALVSPIILSIRQSAFQGGQLWLVGGSYNSGNTNLTLIDSTSGAENPGFAFTSNNPVYSILETSLSSLWLGTSATTVRGSAVGKASLINPTSGTGANTVANTNGTVYKVIASDVASYNWIGGNFSAIGSQRTPSLMLIDSNGRSYYGSPW